jgi:hypothetical protein
MMARLFEEGILKSWWVILFMLICYMVYEQGMRSRNIQYRQLEQQFLDLQKDKRQSLSVQEDLALQINSQSDPAWVELTLMKGLGLVPEGHVKIFFNKR